MANRRFERSRPAIPRYLRLLSALVLLVCVIYFGKSVLVPLALAVLLTFILTPLVTAVQHQGFKRVPAVLTVVAVTLIIAGFVGWGVEAQLAKLARDLPTHRSEIQAKIDHLRESGTGPLSRLLEIFNGVPKPVSPDTAHEKTVVVVRSDEPTPVQRLSSIAAAALEPVADAGLVLILVVFMLIRREDLRNRFIGLLGHGRLTGTTRVLVESAHRLSRFLLMQLSVNAGFGILLGLALLAIGVPYWFLWGCLAFVLRFVPYLGTWLAAALPTVLSFAIFPGWFHPLLVLSSFILIDLVTANVVEPLLFGHSTGISPVALLVAAVFWTWIWGPIGLVLSTPMTVCMVVLGQHVPRFRFLSLLLGDQPALAPHAAFYQRLLAGDAEEATVIAKEFVRRHGVESLPDDLIVPAVRLARRDRVRSGLTARDEAFILDATQRVIEASASQSTIRGNEVLSLTHVLGCPSHHRSEELALEMLGIVLLGSGCRLEVMTTRTLPVELESKIQREQPALICITVIPPGGLPQCRYLCRRLRSRFPDLPILVCYLGKTRAFDRLLVRLRAAGASYVNTSIAQTRGQMLAMLDAVAVVSMPAPEVGSPAVS